MRRKEVRGSGEKKEENRTKDKGEDEIFILIENKRAGTF